MKTHTMMKKKISVAYFTTTTARAGAEEHILSLVQQLDRRYFDVYLACSPELASLLQPDLPNDVAVLKVYFERPTQLNAAFQLGRFLRRHHIDILHSHMFRASLVASPLAKLCGVPVTIETPHVREDWRRGWLKSRFFIDRLGGRSVDYYIAVSESNARYLMDPKGLPERKIRVIHNGIDLSQFDPRHVAPEGLRQSLGFGPDDPVMALFGRLEPQKGHGVLLEALYQVRKEFPGVHLICAGDGSLRAELERRADTLQIRDAVRFVGYQHNVADWLALADFSVLPSFYEGLPLVAIESLAAGRTMIATAVDGTPEVVVDGRTGLTVPAGDPDALAGAILRLLREPALRRRLAQAGRKWVLERFSLEKQIQNTQDLYFRAWEERVRLASQEIPQTFPERPGIGREVLAEDGITIAPKE